MSPEQLTEFNTMKETLASIERGENTVFLQNILRRIDIPSFLKKIRLNDLADVDTSGVANGEIIKYAASTNTWVNADDT